jgi:hypothetical protein
MSHGRRLEDPAVSICRRVFENGDLQDSRTMLGPLHRWTQVVVPIDPFNDIRNKPAGQNVG